MAEHRWFLSYNSQDSALAERFEKALAQKDSGARVFFARTGLRAGGYWMPELAKEIAESSAFVLLVGEHGLGPWQVSEYCEAYDRRVKQQDFPVILVLDEKQPAPGLPFLRQLHWIIASDPASEKSIGQVLEASHGAGATSRALWRHTAPYRGLAAMTEADSDYFFGRDHETVEIVQTLASAPGRIPILLGNSGVGKSSLARAGVVAALMRQAWPEIADGIGPWPRVFEHSRSWCFMALRPGTEPVSALVEAFLETWQLGSTSTERPDLRVGWEQKLLDGRLSLRDLLDQTRRRFAEMQQAEPPAFLLYVDQGEELYVLSNADHARRFSQILAAAASDPRLHIIMSLRSDFYGELQKDEALWSVQRQINVTPLRETELRQVVGKPAALLGAHFETENLARDIARRAAEESTIDAGALPLLSYLLDDMWRHMVERGDGELHLPPQAIELGSVLVDRADEFVAKHLGSEDALKRILTLKLATVREDGEPTRRRAFRSEFTDEEWRLVGELSGHPNRILNTVAAENDGGEAHAEVAHEAIFRRWDKLKEWIAGEREFLAWRSGLEAARRTFESAPAHAKSGALLMGLALTNAQAWLGRRAPDIPEMDRSFIASSIHAERRKRLRFAAYAGAGAIVALVGWFGRDNLFAAWREFTVVLPYRQSNFASYVLTASQEQALRPGNIFTECRHEIGPGKQIADRCPEMVVVPAGSFAMGSSPDAKGHEPDEEPQHRVTIARAFAASKYEVTFAEWDACVEAGGCGGYRPSDDDWGRGNHPVVNVSWDDAEQYVQWLSRMTGKAYRLLSEAEFEYAARAGTKTSRYWGEDAANQCLFANGLDQSAKKDYPSASDIAACSDGYSHTAPVGSFRPNAFGLYDMLGNVWKWTEDCYHPSYKGAPADGGAWLSGRCGLRILRGGSWSDPPSSLRSAQRGGNGKSGRGNTFGFFVARDL